MKFYLTSNDTLQSVNVNMDTTGASEDLYINGNTTYRPKVVAIWGRDGVYFKPANGIPKSDLASDVQSAIDKANDSASQSQATLTETYGDPLDSQWAFSPSQVQGYDITMNVVST